MSAQQPTRILVVDDDAGTCGLVERVLRDAGYEVSTTTSPLAALNLVKEGRRFDLVVADVMMPEMSGDELVARLRRIDDELKVLYLTGYVDQLFTKKERLWEDEAFVEKPQRPEGLVEAVSLLLCGHIAPAMRLRAL